MSLELDCDLESEDGRGLGNYKTFLTSFEKLPNYEIYRERYLQIYIYTLIYKVYTNALYIIPFCLHLVNCCRGKFTSTANRSNAYVYDTVMCQWCLWL